MKCQITNTQALVHLYEQELFLPQRIKFSNKDSEIKKKNFSPKNLLIGLFNKHGHTPEISPYGSGQNQFHFLNSNYEN